ncbi:hypothetical protein Fmac_014723 [Flemingia macrophylla]|uniref:Uncharacterized protein n=1 Tax=Flemingia macrophylla TaxID=520843 RepID=A0ABD1MCJ7_9FABA
MPPQATLSSAPTPSPPLLPSFSLTPLFSSLDLSCKCPPPPFTFLLSHIPPSPFLQRAPPLRVSVIAE